MKNFVRLVLCVFLAHAAVKKFRELFGIDSLFLSGFMNPDFYLFDHDAIEAGEPLVVRNRLPYSDINDLSSDRLNEMREQRLPFEFSHSLDEQIGGQIDAGFMIAGFYEDRWSDEATSLNSYMPTSMATLAIKPNTQV